MVPSMWAGKAICCFIETSLTYLSLDENANN